MIIIEKGFTHTVMDNMFNNVYLHSRHFFFILHGVGRNLMYGVILTSPVVHLTNNITTTLCWEYYLQIVVGY